jgi:YVTN family beta-propeller protein
MFAIRRTHSRLPPLSGLVLLLVIHGTVAASPSRPSPQTKSRAADEAGLMDNVHQLGMRPDGKELWTSTLERHIVVVNIESPDYPIAGELHLPGNSSHPISEITFSPDSRYAYVTDSLQCTLEPNCPALGFGDLNRVLVIDTASKTIVRIIPLPAPYSPTGSHTIAPDARFLYLTVTDYQRDGLYKLDLQTGEMAAFLEIPGTNFVTVASDGKHLFVTRGWDLNAPPPNLLSVVDTDTFQMTASVAVGTKPWFVAISPDQTKAYVANMLSNNVSVVDLSDLGAMRVTATVGVTGQPKGTVVTADGKRVYVGIFRDASGNGAYGPGLTVSVVDAETNQYEKDVRVGEEPASLVIDPQGARVFVSDGNANGLRPAQAHVIDAARAVYQRQIVVRQAGFYTPTGIDVTPDGSRLFVICEARKTLAAIDAASGAVLAAYAVDPRAVKVSRDGRTVYVYSARQPGDGHGRFFAIDTDSLQVLRSLDLGVITTHSPWDSIVYRIAMNSGETTAYLAGGDGDEVIVVDLVLQRVVSRIWVGAEGNRFIAPARGIVITPDDKRVFVSSCLAQKVSVIDTVTNSIIASVPVPDCPSEVKISADGKRVFIHRQFATTMMTVLDADTFAVVKHVAFPPSVHAVLDFYLSADERWLYSLCFDPNWVMVYDISEANTWGVVTSLIKTRLDPFNGVVTADRSVLYVTDFSSDAISALDIGTYQVTRTIALPPVLVIVHPASMAVAAGSVASFTASADGAPTPTVRWQTSADNGATWSDIGGASETTYSVTVSAADHGKQYRAVFTNTRGTAVTKPAALSVLAVLSVSPSSGSIAGGTVVTVTGTGFTVGATSVSIGGNAARDTVVTASSRLTAVTPPGPIGAAAVTVTTASGTVSVPGGFTYFSPFTDDPLLPGTTPVKRIHIVELRQQIDTIRTGLGLVPFAWTDMTIVARVTAAGATHVNELRAALKEAYVAAGRTPPLYTDPTLAPGSTVIRVVHLAELRAAVLALQ